MWEGVEGGGSGSSSGGWVGGWDGVCILLLVVGFLLVVLDVGES